MPPTQNDNNENDPFPWQQRLSSPDPLERLNSLAYLASLPSSSEAMVRSLEKTVLKDADARVRQAAETALLHFPHQPVYRQLLPANDDARRYMLYELDRLEKEGLLEGPLAAVLKARYALAAEPDPSLLKPSAPTPVSPSPAQPFQPQLQPTGSQPSVLPKKSSRPAPSLTQILLSETAIKIALYLGAFFVIAAAFILAALVEVSRLPVLAAATLIFLSVALGLSRRLPLASFVLFCMVVLLAPIDGQVLLPYLEWLGRAPILIYWSLVWLFTLLLAGLGLFFYRSRLMSVVVYLAGLIGLFYLSQALILGQENTLFLAALWGLAGLGLAFGLFRLWGSRVFWPLFLSVQLIQALILLYALFDWSFSLASILFNSSDSALSVFGSMPIAWGWAAGDCLALGVYYFLSDWTARKLTRPLWGLVYPALLALLPLPVYLAMQLNSSMTLLYVGLWGWSLLLAAGGEGLRFPQFYAWNRYRFAFLAAFVGLSCLVPLGFLLRSDNLSLTLTLAGTALAAVLLSRLQLRWFFNAMAILFAVSAYFVFFQVPQLASFRDSLLLEEVLLPPALILLALDWLARYRRWSSQVWLPPLLFGLPLYALAFVLGPLAQMDQTSPLVYAAWRYFFLYPIQVCFFIYYARSYKPALSALPWSVALLNAYLAVFYFLKIPAILSFNLFTPAVYALPALLFLSLEWVLRRRRAGPAWQLPPLILGAAAVLLDLALLLTYSPNQTGMVVAVLALYALFWGLEARSLSQWLWVPWALSLAGAYAAYLLFWTIPALEGAFHPDGILLRLPPALVFFGLEWAMRIRRRSLAWTLPPLLFAVLAALVNLLSLASLKPEQTWMAVVALVLYAVLWGFESRSLKTWFWLPWSLSLLFFYCAYLLFWTIPSLAALHLDPLLLRLPPALILLGLEWLQRKRALPFLWRVFPLALGSAALLVNLIPLLSPTPSFAWTGFIVLLLYALFFGLEAAALQSPVWLPWSFSLVFLYSTYLYFWQIPQVSALSFNPLVTLLPPPLVFLGLEWILRGRGRDRSWSWPALAAGLLALVVNCAFILVSPPGDSFFVLLAALVYALFLGAYSYSKIPRFYLFWTGALLFACLAYWRLFDQSAWPWAAWNDASKLLPLAILWLGFYLFLRRRSSVPSRWLPALLLGGAGALIDAAFTLQRGLLVIPSSIDPAVIFAVWGLFLVLYLWMDRRPWVGYLSTASLVLAVCFTLKYADVRQWVLPLNALAAVFYLAGFWVSTRLKSPEYSRPFLYSALLLAGLVSLTTFVEYKPSGAAGAALGAVLFTLEGLRRRQVWWGFPACVLYFIAYSQGLLQLQIKDPQYFSIGAALLGIIMHYLLLKTANSVAALITGTLSQLILFGTSYIQMAQSLELKFFFMLFFQSMVLFPYGLVVRSRTLVLGPIAFAILGVVTVTLTILKGLSTALIIGITGLLLLVLGILGLWMRERLTKWVESFKLRLENW